MFHVERVKNFWLARQGLTEIFGAPAPVQSQGSIAGVARKLVTACANLVIVYIFGARAPVVE